MPSTGLMIGLANAGQGGGFTPASVPGIAAWWDAADAATITLNVSDVSAITDKSGNARTASQATAAEQPAYVTAGSGINGKGAISFTAGSNDALLPGNALTVGKNKPGITFAGVVRITTLGAAQRIFSILSSAVGVALFAVSVNNVGELNIISRRVGADTAANLVSTAVVVAGTAHFIAASVDFSTGTIKLWIDGTLRTQTAAWVVGAASENADPSFPPALGRFATNTITGLVGEAMLWSRTLSDQEISDLRNLYLKPKWALA